MKMNKIIAFVVVLATLFSYANENVYMLKYDAYVWMLDKNGKKLKSGRFKAGTKFTIIVDDESSSAKVKDTKYIAPKTFKVVAEPRRMAKFLCKCEITDDYAYEWRGYKMTHWSIYILAYSDDGEDYEYFYACVEKESVLGKKIFALLKDGKKHWANVVLQYVPTKCTLTAYEKAVEIVDFIQTDKKLAD